MSEITGRLLREAGPSSITNCHRAGGVGDRRRDGDRPRAADARDVSSGRLDRPERRFGISRSSAGIRRILAFTGFEGSAPGSAFGGVTVRNDGQKPLTHE
jgi:hypothetical protein